MYNSVEFDGVVERIVENENIWILECFSQVILKSDRKIIFRKIELMFGIKNGSEL